MVVEPKIALNKLWLLLIPIGLQVFTSFVFKTAADHTESFDLVGIATNVFYWLTLGLLVVRALSWSVILTFFDLSFAYPILSIHLVGILIVGATVFNETIEWQHWAGTCLIITGIITLATDKK